MWDVIEEIKERCSDPPTLHYPDSGLLGKWWRQLLFQGKEATMWESGQWELGGDSIGVCRSGTEHGCLRSITVEVCKARGADKRAQGVDVDSGDNRSQDWLLTQAHN